MPALGVLVSILVLVVLVSITCTLYFYFRKKYAHSKFLIEACFIGFAILFSIAMKFIIYFKFSTKDFWSAFDSFLQAFFSGIGGLTFEGLDDIDAVGQILKSLYYVSSLYAGLMTLIIISAKANYEFFSMLMLLWDAFLAKIKRLFRCKEKKNIFVITDITEESFQLALDIKKEAQNPLIIFAGPTLNAFDRHDELCRQLMAQGFLYWSYSKRKKDGKKRKSIAKTLHLNCFNHKEKMSREDYQRRFIVYAFASKNHIPLEEENLDIVFDDIRTRIEQKDSLRIEYYLLTKREVNYQSYTYLNKEMMLRFALKRMELFLQDQKLILDSTFQTYFLTDHVPGTLDKTWKKLKHKIEEKYGEEVVLNIWCEAKQIGRQAVQKMMEEGLATYLATHNDGLRVWALGFGNTGQAITNELFVQSANVDEQGKTRDYMVDVFDQNISEVGGMFQKQHGECFCLHEEELFHQVDENVRLQLHSLKNSNQDRVESYFRKNILPIYLHDVHQNGRNKEMPMPIYWFHPLSCMGFEFFEGIKEEISSKETEQLKEEFSKNHPAIAASFSRLPTFDRPQVIIVSTGDDYRNVRITNALIEEMMEKPSEENPQKQYIIVNIWDAHNNSLLINGMGTWNREKNVLVSGSVVVIIVGNNREIYTYGASVALGEEEMFNSSYLQMSDWMYEESKKEKSIVMSASKELKKLGSCEKEEVLTFLQGMREKFKNEAKNLTFNKDKKVIPEQQYCSIGIWQRESTRSATLFAPVMQEKYLEYVRKGMDELTIYHKLSMIEHNRWMRMHLVHGWEYNETKVPSLRHHDCLLPWDQLRDDVILYDTLNVFWDIISVDEEGKKN